MSRTVGALSTHLADNAHTLATLLRLDLADGTVLAVCDHDADLGFDLGDGPATYRYGTGILPSSLALATGFAGNDVEISGPIGDSVTRTAVLGGRFDDATARLFKINWNRPGDGAVKLLQGRVVLASVEGGKFKFTVHGDVTRFSQTIGRQITAYCDADFGDARCGMTPVTTTATVTNVTDAHSFTVSYAGAYADNFFNYGTAAFTSGALAGTRAVEVFDWSQAGAVALWTSLAEPPAIGDTLTLTQGCSKTRFASTNYEATVTAVTDARHFTVNLGGVHPDGFFTGQPMIFLTGAAAADAADYVLSGYTGATAAVVLSSSPPAAPAIGDKVRFSVIDTTIPGCLSYGNLANFRGFPDVPGSDQVLQYPNPGS